MSRARLIAAGTIGNVLEWYDFSIYGFFALQIGATFFPSGFEHSFTSTAGSAWAKTPWHAVQRAAAATLDRRELREPARDWTTTDDSPR